MENNNLNLNNCHQQNDQGRTTIISTTEDNTSGLPNESSPDNTSTNVTTRRIQITQRRKNREEVRPRIQWTDRMKKILMLLKSGIGNRRGWSKTLSNQWNERLPIYRLFTQQNLID